MTQNTPHDFIEEFFIADNNPSPNGLNRRSVFLCAFRDMQFSNGIFFHKLEQTGVISKRQEALINNDLPTFSYFLTYFAAIDTLGRVMNLGRPKKDEVAKFFKDSASKWFEVKCEHLTPLWNLRNGLTHHYHLKQDGIRSHGAELMTERSLNGSWSISATAAFGTIRKAKKNAYDFIRKQTPIRQEPYNQYIEKNGFIYTQGGKHTT